MIWIILLGIVVFCLLLLAYALCRISGDLSREEEKEEIEHFLKVCPICKGECINEGELGDLHYCKICNATGWVVK